ncbi:MAG: NAD(P)H-hydrate epimerase [Bacteroidia bacterium]|nr:NAD(P)H-hydrate epimerase [Bacteroidia bacterium]
MSAYIKVIPPNFPIIDTAQMIIVDRLMIEEYHIILIQMMENAGRCLALLAREAFFGGNPAGKTVAILAGTGGNGGGAMVCARRLHNWGARVEVYLTNKKEKMTPVPAHQLDILDRMGIPITDGQALPRGGKYDLLVDGIIGYSVKGDPYGTAAYMIEWLNSRTEKVLSLDTPSGLDLTSGKIHNPTAKADATLTLALPKKGLFEAEAKRVIGDLYLGDISVPPELYAHPELGLELGNLFQESDVLRIY